MSWVVLFCSFLFLFMWIYCNLIFFIRFISYHTVLAVGRWIQALCAVSSDSFFLKENFATFQVTNVYCTYLSMRWMLYFVRWYRQLVSTYSMQCRFVNQLYGVSMSVLSSVCLLAIIVVKASIFFIPAVNVFHSWTTIQHCRDDKMKSKLSWAHTSIGLECVALMHWACCSLLPQSDKTSESLKFSCLLYWYGTVLTLCLNDVIVCGQHFLQVWITIQSTITVHFMRGVFEAGRLSFVAHCTTCRLIFYCILQSNFSNKTLCQTNFKQVCQRQYKSCRSLKPKLH